jgi:Fe2+ or Zn2+ uptake regulation protein
MPPDRPDAQRHKEAQMRSNPVRDAIMNLIEERPEAGPTTAEEVHGALPLRTEVSTVAYHLSALANRGLLKRSDSRAEPRFQLSS